MLLGKFVKLTAFVLIAVACSGVVAQEGKDKDKKEAKKDEKKTRKPAFTVGKETTRVVGPLDNAGRIDYETALNEKLREGVTPDNNANVLLFKAFGPHPGGAKLPEDFFKWMQVPAPPEKGDYFVGPSAYRLILGNRDPKKVNSEVWKMLDKAMLRPWSAKEYPDVADWLKLNEKPLAVAVAASKRTHYYYPTLGARKDGKTLGLISAQIAGVQECRQLAGALAARAMLRVFEKRYDEAWQDLLACHRLGRLVGRGGTLIEALVGMALEGVAREADLAFLDAAQLDAKKLKACLRDLQELPPTPSLADKLDLTERYWALETIMLLDRDGIDHLGSLTGNPNDSDPLTKMLGKWITTDVQWDPALRNTNKVYDRMVAAMRLKDRTDRDLDLQQVHDDIGALRASLTEAKDIARTIFGAKSISEAKGKYVGDVLICLFDPATMKVRQAADRTEQTQRNLQIAFALAAYKADEKRYPKMLDTLAPKYLPAIPGDLFSGKALIYRPAEKGDAYLLYSVGVNGKDEQGRGDDDESGGDDLPVRMPLPKLRARQD